MEQGILTTNKCQHSDYMDNMECVLGYTVEDKIGSGSFSDCYLAIHDLTQRQVALKVTPLKEGSIHLHQRKCRLWRELKHPNIITLYEHREGKDRSIMVCEYAAKGELYQLMLQHSNGLPLNRAMKYFTDILQGISYLHSLGIAHRDLKLENIFIDDNDRAKIGDFDFAEKFTNERRLCKNFCGSLEYSPPEILLKQEYDPFNADCWSLGVIFHALVTGYLPFSRVSDELITDTVSLEKMTRRRILAGITEFPHVKDENIKRILHGLLQSNPLKRWSVQNSLMDNLFKDQVVYEKEKLSLADIKSIMIGDLPGVQLYDCCPQEGSVEALMRILEHAKFTQNKEPLSPEMGVIEVVRGEGIMEKERKKSWLERLSILPFSSIATPKGNRPLAQDYEFLVSSPESTEEQLSL